MIAQKSVKYFLSHIQVKQNKEEVLYLISLWNYGIFWKYLEAKLIQNCINKSQIRFLNFHFRLGFRINTRLGLLEMLSSLFYLGLDHIKNLSDW